MSRFTRYAKIEPTGLPLKEIIRRTNTNPIKIKVAPTELQPFEPLRPREAPDPRDEYAYHSPNTNDPEVKHIEWMQMSDSNRAMHAILDEAKGIVCGDRQDAYGPPIDNHTRTSEGINWYLKHCGKTLDARDICWLNVIQKISRDLNERRRDNLLDVIGYCANAESCTAASLPVNGT